MNPIDYGIADALDVPFTFARTPSPLEGEFRPGWRIAVLLLMLDQSSRGGKSSFSRLHLFNWGIRSEEGRRALSAAAAGREVRDSVLIRYEPSFHRAIVLAAGLDLVTLEGGKRVQITDQGRAAAKLIREHDGILKTERAFLDALGYHLTEKLTRELVWGS